MAVAAQSLVFSTIFLAVQITSLKCLSGHSIQLFELEKKENELPEYLPQNSMEVTTCAPSDSCLRHEIVGKSINKDVTDTGVSGKSGFTISVDKNRLWQFLCVQYFLRFHNVNLGENFDKLNFQVRFSKN